MDPNIQEYERSLPLSKEDVLAYSEENIDDNRFGYNYPFVIHIDPNTISSMDSEFCSEPVTLLRLLGGK